MTQRDVSERTGLATSYLSRLENGLITPSIGTLEKLARALEVPMGAFFGPEEAHELDKGCPVSISGDCIRNHPIIKRGRKPAQKESYTPQQLRTLSKCNYLLQRGDRQVLAALTTMMDAMVALLEDRRREHDA